MKTKKNILSCLNLVFFISSLLFSSISGYGAEQLANELNHTEHHFISKHATSDTTSTQVVFEENEKESEKTFHSTAGLVHVVVSSFHPEVSEKEPVACNAAAIKFSEPIYLAICNFRI